MSLDHIQEELDEIYNFDYKFSVMKLFTINDKGAMFARSICGIGEALKGFIFQFRHENEINAKLTEDNDKLKKENEKLKEEIKENEGYEQMKKISNVKTDLINELFSKMVQEADIDDGISISKEYGNKYIDEWNKIYEDIIKDTIKVMNKCQLVDGVYLQFHTCSCIEFCMNDTTDDECEEDSD